MPVCAHVLTCHTCTASLASRLARRCARNDMHLRSLQLVCAEAQGMSMLSCAQVQTKVADLEAKAQELEEVVASIQELRLDNARLRAERQMPVAQALRTGQVRRSTELRGGALSFVCISEQVVRASLECLVLRCLLAARRQVWHAATGFQLRFHDLDFTLRHNVCGLRIAFKYCLSHLTSGREHT